MNRTEQALEITDKPRHIHDCGCCTFLGTYPYGRDTLDLYVHGGNHATVIARYGSEGPEYTSGLEASYGGNGPLTAARLRAQERGLLEYDVYQALHYAQRDTAAHAELVKALPFTLEYQAWLALFRRRDEARSQFIASHLLQLEMAKKYRKDRSLGTCLLEVEARIRKVLTAMREGGDVSRFDQSEYVMEFLWPVDPPPELETAIE